MKPNFEERKILKEILKLITYSRKIESGKAEFYLARAGCELGIDDMFVYLGFSYYSGTGVKKNYREALTYFRRAADSGNREAMSYIGLMHHEGKGGLKKDDKSAVKLYREAAAGNEPMALCNLGLCYKFGHGVRINLKKAFCYFLRSSRLLHVPSYVYLGEAYLNGKGTERDYGSAVNYLRKSIREDGSPYAKGYLGICYYNGRGVRRNPGKAVELYREAAGHGIGWAWYYLGLCYLDGEGVAADSDKAKESFTLAVKNGYDEAVKYLT